MFEFLGCRLCCWLVLKFCDALLECAVLFLQPCDLSLKVSDTLVTWVSLRLFLSLRNFLRIFFGFLRYFWCRFLCWFLSLFRLTNLSDLSFGNHVDGTVLNGVLAIFEVERIAFLVHTVDGYTDLKLFAVVLDESLIGCDTFELRQDVLEGSSKFFQF